MNVYDINISSFDGQTHSVVAENMAHAERIYNAKYWPNQIKSISLHSVYVQIQEHDEQAKKL